MRRRDESFNEGWGQIATLLEIVTLGGKQKVNCVSTKGAFRLIQSIPSKKAEPFKRWLAKVGYERVQEIENPELAQERMKFLYEQKGYSKDWIEKRLRGFEIKDENSYDQTKDELEAMRNLLLFIMEHFGVFCSKHNKLNINVEIKKNKNL